MCLDLNKVALYGEPDGRLRSPSNPQNRRRYYVLVDGIIAGQGNGPMDPDPMPAGVLIFGTNPATVDATAAVLMGFDPEKIPMIRNAFGTKQYSIAEWRWQDTVAVSNRCEWSRPLPDISREQTLHFEPHFGWKGHIERD